ncbi:MAG: TerB family tellurite resistance protein [Comamonadaceae bacterium]|nr:MAG: TerB family tellurite resistance protein [Comamonadaceae bacterium]
MFATLKDLFESFTAPLQDRSPAAKAHSLQLATAVLLVEVMRADSQHGAEERARVFHALHEKFRLADDEVARLVELAEETAKTAYDYQRFTGILNDHLDHAQKIRVVEHLWEIAYADLQVDANENHAISKIAGLLHVTHGEYIAAKLHAKAAASQA